MPIAFVQSTKASGAGFPQTVVTPAFSGSTVSGNAIIVGAMSQSGANAIDSVTDSKGNTYVRRGQGNNSTSINCEIWVAENITGGASHTVTVTENGFLAGGLIAFEVSGLATSSSFDVTNKGSGTGGTLNSGDITTTQADEILIGFGGITSTTNPTWTQGTSYLPSPPVSTSGTGTGYAIAMEYRIVSATGTYNAILTSSNTGQNWAMVVVSLKQAGGGGGALEVSKSESITVTESINRLPENYVSKSESIGVAEAIVRQSENFISKSDSISVSENRSLLIPELHISKSESITVSESISRLTENYISKTDNISVAETVTSNTVNTIAVQDSVSVSELLLRELNSFISKSESVSVSESVNRYITEFFLNKNESVSVSESLNHLVTNFINKTESLTVSDAPSMGGVPNPNLNQPVTVGEQTLVRIEGDGIGIFESVSISESIQIQLSANLLSVQDSVSVSESLNREVNNSLSLNETTSISENLASLVEVSIQKSESVSTSESIDRSLSLDIQKSESISVSELTNFFSSELSLNLSESISVSDRVSLTGIERVYRLINRKKPHLAPRQLGRSRRTLGTRQLRSPRSY